jgi:hypothetical protein
MACAGEAGPVRPRVSLGQPRAQYRFDTTAEPWDVFRAPGDQALFRLGDGVLEGAVVKQRGYLWSLNHNRYNDAAIEATVQQTQGDLGNGFGVLCRADADGNGYYFVISSDGQFAILKATSNAPDPAPLVNWGRSPVIRPGLNTVNTLQAVCASAYLSLAVNGILLAVTADQTFRVGELGVVVGAGRTTTWASFDDIIVRDAILTR